MKSKKKELTNEMKSAKKQYYRNYRKQHPEKYKEAQHRFWQKKAQEQQGNDE